VRRMWPIGSTTKEFLKSKYGGILFVIIAVLGLFAPSFYDIDATAPMVLAAKYLGVPITAICFYAFLFKIPSPKSLGGWIIGCVLTLVFSVLLIVVSSGYLVFANALGPWQSETLVEGRVVRLRVAGTKVRRYELSIVDAAERRTTLDIGWAEYHRLSVGETYSKRWKIGSLGILYK